MKKIFVCFVCFCIIPSFSFAQEQKTTRQLIQVKESERVFGIGVSGGFGVDAETSFSSFNSSARGVWLGPRFDLQAFLPYNQSIEVTFPIVNMVYISSLRDEVNLVTESSFNFNLGKNQTRLVLGPGFGLAYSFLEGKSEFAIRFPSKIGLEFLTSNNNFSFRVMSEPFIACFITSRNHIDSYALGYGVIGTVGFYGYFVK